MVKYVYWRRGKKIMRAEAEFFKNNWWKKSWTTEVVREFEDEETAEAVLQIFYNQADKQKTKIRGHN